MSRMLAALLCGVCSFVTLAADAPLKPTDFAYGMALQTDGRDGVYKVSLPLDVYRVVRYTDLRDLRVFNADGEVVPHVVTRSAGSVSVKSEPIELPRFPVYASEQRKLGDLDLQIKRDSQGAVINLSNRSGVAGQNKPVGYLLDGSKVGPAIKEIELQWSESIANYVSSVSVEASDDLATWGTLAKDAPVTRMGVQPSDSRTSRQTECSMEKSRPSALPSHSRSARSLKTNSPRTGNGSTSGSVRPEKGFACTPSKRTMLSNTASHT